MASKHGHRNPVRTPTYVSWQHMKDRCYNEASEFFGQYGGRGIKVCHRWRTSFANFLADLGPRPEGTSLDRIDVHGDYQPENCRWATVTDQALNRRNSKLNRSRAAKRRRQSVYTNGRSRNAEE
jgi:hypothetical protein